MATDVGIKMTADGAKEFKAAISGINAQIKNLNSEMKLAVQSFDGAANSEQALATKSDILQRSIESSKQKVSILTTEYDKQKSKLSELEQALSQATTEFGANSKEAADAGTAYNRQATAVNKLGTQLNNARTDLHNMNSQLDHLGDDLDKTGSSTIKFGDLLKANLLSNVILNGVKKLADGIVEVGKALANIVLDDYANYEQLVGGVDTLFGENSKQVQQYALEAYKTAGLGANEYMETVTSFSASLLQSLGGDTAAAAESANQALIDMSDNANKMGTDMSSIQNAYQGFAKQNYTMLDNLKLGYGGTKQEMERLLSDAEKLTGVKYDINNLNDVYSAIHAVQTEMGITGTTAKEASETISGSIGAMKSAWSNLLVGLASGDLDISALVSNLIESVITVGKNVIPRVGVLIEGIKTAIVEAIPQIKETAFNLLTEYGPQVIEKGGELLSNLSNGFVEKIPELASAIGDFMSNFLSFLAEHLPTVIEKGAELLGSLATGIINAIPAFVEKLPQIILSFTEFIKNNFPQIVESGVKLVGQLIVGIGNAIPDLVASLPSLIAAIVQGVGNLMAGVIKAGEDIVKGLWQGISNQTAWICNKIKGFCKNALEEIKDFFGIASPSRVMRDEVGVMIGEGMAEGIKNSIKTVKKSADTLSGAAFRELKNGIAIGDLSAKMTVGTQLATNDNVFKAIEGAVNGFSTVSANSGTQNFIIQLVTDGKTLAEVVFDPLKGVAKQRGVALG